MEEPEGPGILELVKISLPNSDDKVKFLRNHKIHGTLVYQAKAKLFYEATFILIVFDYLRY